MQITFLKIHPNWRGLTGLKRTNPVGGSPLSSYKFVIMLKFPNFPMMMPLSMARWGKTSALSKCPEELGWFKESVKPLPPSLSIFALTTIVQSSSFPSSNILYFSDLLLCFLYFHKNWHWLLWLLSPMLICMILSKRKKNSSSLLSQDLMLFPKFTNHQNPTYAPQTLDIIQRLLVFTFSVTWSLRWRCQTQLKRYYTVCTSYNLMAR